VTVKAFTLKLNADSLRSGFSHQNQCFHVDSEPIDPRRAIAHQPAIAGATLEFEAMAGGHYSRE
jgi:hypothetical protein